MPMKLDKIICTTQSSETTLRIVVKLKTEHYFDSKGNVVVTKKLTQLKSKSRGSISDILIDVESIPYIHNLYSCVDGMYELIVDHVVRDWEYSTIDYCDYKLIRYVEEY